MEHQNKSCDANKNEKCKCRKDKNQTKDMSKEKKANTFESKKGSN